MKMSNKFIILSLIFVICHYALPKTVEFYPPHQVNLACSKCLRIYFPLCASDNKTYTNECRFRCVQSKKLVNQRAKIIRYGPCILGSRKKRAVINLPDGDYTD